MVTRISNEGGPSIIPVSYTHLDVYKRQTLQRVLEGLDRSQTIPDDQRDRIVTALEDVAVDVDAERTAFQSMVQAAENDARIF